MHAKSTLFLVLTSLVLLAAAAIKIDTKATGRLVQDEVEALEEIARQLGKTDWNFEADPCSNDTSWNTPLSGLRPLYNNSLVCNCSFAGGVCHVTKIFLRGQDLQGSLPSSLQKLPYLTAIDFNMNYLNGTIPTGWTSLQLYYLVLSANKLTGSIPSFLGIMTNLVYLSMEDNMFSGTIPPELGKLVNLQMLILSANNLKGELPEDLANLKSLTELRISSNNLGGKIPSFIGSWKQIQMLEMQGSGLEGPIPASVSVLSNLIELRISDLNGGISEFPSLKNMKNMTRLMLRSCNISGVIPSYLSDMSNLMALDLSFNRLTGNIPDLSGIDHLQYIYLTSNLLTGSIPDWIKSRDTRYNIDLSYNNFSNSSPPACRETLNLFKSFHNWENSVKGTCLMGFQCSEVKYALHINCGGKETTIEKIKYEADQDPGGMSKFNPGVSTWGISTTGYFWDSNSTSNDFVANNKSVLTMENSELYTSSRLSPLSLTYYAHCLENGNYSVKLHFAEIVIRDNRSYQSLGRRVFDVYVQDQLVSKAFNVKQAAHGADKATILEFTATVQSNTLAIRFHWAGKGTTDTPKRGTYGPLVSAISIESDFSPPHRPNRKVIATISAVILVLVVSMIFGILRWKGYIGQKASREEDLRGLDLQTGIFTFRQIKAATNDFDAANKLGEGGFGSVYKGTQSDGTMIAVKQLSSRSKQGNREFINEIGMISGLRHPNLVRLYGCCVEGKQLLLVYEFLENNNLGRALLAGDMKLDWSTRQKICIGIAKGLAFLHEESTIKIVHRDIKATNVLLDKDLNPKISDFGLAKLDDEEKTHVTTRVAGTIGYMAPEYAMWGYLTDKVDVYSFGVLALEIVAGKNMRYQPDQDFVCLLDWALFLQQKGDLMDLVDPNMGSNFNKEEAIRMVKVALLCTHPSPALRPKMSAVVTMLQGTVAIPEVIYDPSMYRDGTSLTALKGQIHKKESTSSSNSETENLIRPSQSTWSGSSSRRLSRSLSNTV